MSTKTKPPVTIEEEENQDDLPDVLKQLAPYWRMIAGIAIVAITAIVLYGVVSNNRRAAEGARWDAYFAAVGSGDANGLQQLAKSGSGPVVPWAYQAAAQAKLVDGMGNLYENREQAKADFEEAIDGFNNAVARSDQIDLLNQRSLWGLAQAHEGANDLAQAKATYQKLQERWPESGFAKRAEERVASLSDPATLDFYKWFFETEPQSLSDASPTLPFSTPTDPVNIPEMGAGEAESATPITDALGGGSSESGIEDLIGDADAAPPTDGDAKPIEEIKIGEEGAVNQDSLEPINEVETPTTENSAAESPIGEDLVTEESVTETTVNPEAPSEVPPEVEVPIEVPVETPVDPNP